jgi:hypothetical protein
MTFARGRDCGRGLVCQGTLSTPSAGEVRHESF